MHKNQGAISFENNVVPESVELARRQKLAKIIGERDKAVIDLDETKAELDKCEIFVFVLAAVAVALFIALITVVSYAKFN